jgi:hypothetical protein
MSTREAIIEQRTKVKGHQEKKIEKRNSRKDATRKDNTVEQRNRKQDNNRKRIKKRKQKKGQREGL